MINFNMANFKMYSFNALQIIRSLDSLLFTFAVIVLIIIHPSIGKNELGQLDIFCIVPCSFIGWVCYQFPPKFKNITQWGPTVFNLRFVAVTLIFLSPFVFWWVLTPNNVYFFINTQLAICSGIAFLLFLTKIILELARVTDAKSLVIEAKIVKTVIFYFSLVPFISFTVSLVLDDYIAAINTYNDFYFIFTQFSHWFQWIFTLPIIICMHLIFRMRVILTNNYSKGENEHSTDYPS